MRVVKKCALNKNLAKPAAASYYGTAGYRLNTEDLNNVICRASVVAYVRSATFVGKYIGLYITASHNPADYNGVKFVDFNGNMLEETWEQSSDELVNCADGEFMGLINKLFRQNSNCSSMHDSIYGNVIIGRDTRDSGEALTNNIKEVLGEFRCNVMDYGHVTCPEMHFLIRKCNERGKMIKRQEYIDHIYSRFVELRQMTGIDAEMGVDTANGMAGLKFAELLEKNKEFRAEVLNDPVTGVLNKECGADYVKTQRSFPKVKRGAQALMASFDGDVDRLILYRSNAEAIRIFDGDAQCTFIAQYLRDLVDAEGIQCDIGVVLSFYSNMGAVEYLQKSFKVVFAQTGIKNFVREARNFDVGIYFEPNGHGSVTFSKHFLEQVDALKRRGPLKVITEIFDPCVGDALANFIFFKAVTSPQDEFIKYRENFIRLLTVRIRDKNCIKVNKNNNVLEPGIQKEIDQVVMSFKGRGFVRPSGTEDLVRVFAECSQEAQCDKLALNIAQIVYDNCDGIGPYPEISYHRD